MILLQREDGTPIRKFSKGAAAIVYHPQFGFVDRHAALGRDRRRRLAGMSQKDRPTELFAFEPSGSTFQVKALGDAKVEKINNGWKLMSKLGVYQLLEVGDATPTVVNEENSDRAGLGILILCLLFFSMATFVLTRKSAEQIAAELPVVEPVVVKIDPKSQRTVMIPPPEVLKLMQNQPQAQFRRAVGQNLGFIGLVGRADLKKALGGMPSSLDASPGAGPGGKEGSGGELLVGLGQGVKRTTVGNTGVAGLGGIGTKGVGGGAGGYGNTMIASGEGKGLSTVPLGKDLVMDGGLDRAVIHATIAKYLGQVRACYEEGLRERPGMTGQLTLNFEIAGKGSVAGSHVTQSSLGHAGVEQCIAHKALSWNFPAPVGGVSVKVNYPFLLRPTGI
jgi:hypothetical protein